MTNGLENPAFEHSAVFLIILGCFFLVVGVASFFVFIYTRAGRRQKQGGKIDAAQPAESMRQAGGGFRPLFYQQPARWLAVRNKNACNVQAALNLNNAKRCSWEEGQNRSTDRSVFITPPVLGWILVVGPGLPDPEDDIDECYHFLVQLSRKLGQVQFYSSCPVVHHHAWARLNRGEVERAYAWAGRTLWNQGEPTPAEIELGLTCFDYCDQPAMVGPLEAAAINVEKIPTLAARWSINPSGIDERVLEQGGGIAGESSPVRPC